MGIMITWIKKHLLTLLLFFGGFLLGIFVGWFIGAFDTFHYLGYSVTLSF